MHISIFYYTKQTPIYRNYCLMFLQISLTQICGKNKGRQFLFHKMVVTHFEINIQQKSFLIVSLIISDIMQILYLITKPHKQVTDCSKHSNIQNSKFQLYMYIRLE